MLPNTPRSKVFEDERTSYFLLYLNVDTFAGEQGEKLANEVRYIIGTGRSNAMEPIVRVVMVHEQDPEAGACDFDRFLHVTPRDLVLHGLYKPIALTLYPGAHGPISLAEICKAMGLNMKAPADRSRELVLNASKVGHAINNTVRSHMPKAAKNGSGATPLSRRASEALGLAARCR